MCNRIVLILLFIIPYLAHSKDKIPRKVRKSIPLMTRYITKDCNGQEEKVKAIYNWITTNIEFDYDRLMDTKYFVGVNAKETFKSKKAISDGYNELMKAMLDEIGIQCEVVAGYVHDIGWKPGDLSLFVQHTWIAVKINGEWKLADPVWDSGYIGKIPYDREYKPKKHLIPLSLYKNPVRRDRVAEKRETKEVDRKDKFDEKPKYKEEIGFVSDPTVEFLLIPSDSFLLDHLPLNPIWQLRELWRNRALH